MAVDLPEVHARSLDTTRVFVAGVGEGQWSAGSACDGWNVCALVNRVDHCHHIAPCSRTRDSIYRASL